MNDGSPDVRTRILDAAFALLNEKGVGELTQPRVAAAAGVRTSHLTYYFPTRNDLLIGIARHTINAMAAGFKESVTRAPAKTSDLVQLLGDAVARQELARVILGLIVASEEDSVIKSALAELIENERAHFREVSAAAGVSLPEEWLPICHATLVGAAVLNLARDTPESEREARHIAEVVVERICGRLCTDAAPVSRARRPSARSRSAPAKRKPRR